MAEKIRVLCVDDETTHLELCQIFLERSGDFTVAIASSAPEALRILELTKFDAIISDYQMPGMDGIGFLKVMRGRGDKTPFIIFTGKGREEVVIEALNAGADFYIQKGGEAKAQFVELAHKTKKAVEGRAAERALKESEERLRTIIHSMQFGVVIIDAQTHTILDSNKKALEMIGGGSESVIGTVCHRFICPAETGKCPVTDLKQTVDSSERVLITLQGEKIPILKSVISTTLKGKEVLIESFVDISDRKRTEDALRESEGRFREQYQNNPLAIFTWQHREGDFILVDCNEMAKSLTRRRVLDFIGKTASEMYATRPEIISEIRQVFSQRTWLSKELISEHFLPGRIVNTIASYVPPDLIMVHMEDITHRRRVEGALRENQARLDLALRSAEMGVWYWDIIKNTRYFDEKTCHLLGIDPATFTGSAEEFFAVVHPDDREKLKEALASTIENDILYEPSYRVIWSDGSIHYITARGRLVRDAKGNPERINGIDWDISERKKAEETLRENEEMHRLVLEFAGISSTLWTTEGHLLMINRYGAANLGGVPEDFIGKTMAEMFGPEAGAVYLERICEVAATGMRMEFEDRVPLREGDLWFLSVHTRITDDLGHVKGVMIFSHDITKRKLAELAYRDSADQLAFAIEGAHLGLWDINYTNLTISHNRYWNNMLGYGTEDTTQPVEWWRQSLHPDDLPAIDTASRDHQNGKTPVLDIVYRIRHRDGRWLWIHTIGRVVSRSAEGKPLRMSGINQDVTMQKQAQEALRESEERFRGILETMEDGYIRGDRVGKIQMVNPAAARLFGYGSVDEMIGIPASSLYRDPTTRDTVVQTMQKYGIIHDFSIEAVRKDGTLFWTSTNGRIIYDWEGNFAGTEGFNREITERKRIETELQTTKRRLTDIINGLPDPTFVIDNTGTVTAWNYAIENLTGVSAAEMVGKGNYAYAIPFYGERRKILIDLALQYDKNEIAKYSNIAFEGKTLVGDTIIATPRAKNTILWGKATPLYDDEGKISGAIEVIRDITEKKRVEQEILSFNKTLEQRVEQRTSQLNASLEDKNVLLREVHHRVKNNLQIVISLLNLQSRYIDDENSRQAILESQNRVRAMALVHEKLYRSTEVATIDLDIYIRFLVNQLFQFYGVKGSAIILNTHIQNINVDINTAIPIGLIVNELVSNSLKHAFPGGKKGEISLAIQRENAIITIEYKDNGVGIPQDFDWRNAESLGLRLVIMLVEQEDGTIELDRSAGTAFTIVVKEIE